MLQLNLQQRVQRCIRHAQQGEPTALIVSADELPRAQAMVGDAPVIVCQAGQMFQRFIRHWAAQIEAECGYIAPRRRRR